MSALPSRQGEFLLVPVGARLPKVCVKCGTRDGVRRTTKRYTVGTSGQAMGGVGGIAGVVLSQALRGMERTLAVAVFAVVLVTVIVIAWLMQRGTQKVELQLPLCAACDDRWTAGEKLRTGIVWALGASVALLALGYASYSTDLLIGAGVIFGLVILGAIAARLPPRFVAGTAPTPEVVSMRVDAPIADDVVARARRHAERRAARADEASDDDA